LIDATALEARTGAADSLCFWPGSIPSYLLRGSNSNTKQVRTCKRVVHCNSHPFRAVACMYRERTNKRVKTFTCSALRGPCLRTQLSDPCPRSGARVGFSTPSRPTFPLYLMKEAGKESMDPKTTQSAGSFPNMCMIFNRWLSDHSDSIRACVRTPYKDQYYAHTRASTCLASQLRTYGNPKENVKLN
jgi:hypothetical protein